MCLWLYPSRQELINSLLINLRKNDEIFSHTSAQLGIVNNIKDWRSGFPDTLF